MHNSRKPSEIAQLYVNSYITRYIEIPVQYDWIAEILRTIPHVVGMYINPDAPHQFSVVIDSEAWVTPPRLQIYHAISGLHDQVTPIECSLWNSHENQWSYSFPVCLYRRDPFAP